MNRTFASIAHRAAFTFAIAAASCAILSRAGADPVPLPTTEDIQKDYDAGQYQEAVKKLARVLPLKGEAGKPYDKAKLLVIKAESHLRLKQNQLAADAFTAASKEAKEPMEVAVDVATSMLLKKSPTGTYKPKSPSDALPTTKPAASAGTPATHPSAVATDGIDVVAADSRKLALSALYNDESKPVFARSQAAMKSGQLQGIMDAIKQLAELHSLELAATGGDDQSKKLIVELGEKSGQMMADSLTKMAATIEKLSADANKITTQTVIQPDGTSVRIDSKRGLMSPDRAALNDIKATCGKIDQAATELTAALGTGAPASFEQNKKTAITVATRANEVLNADYSSQTTGVSGQVPVKGKIRPTGGAGSVPTPGGIGIGGF